MTLRYAKPISIAAIVVGALLLVLGLALGEVLNMVPGALLLLIGILTLVNPIAAVENGEIHQKNPLGMTLRRYPVAGPADLRLNGNKVVHAATGKKVTSLGFGVDKADAEQWRSWLATPPPPAG